MYTTVYLQVTLLLIEAPYCAIKVTFGEPIYRLYSFETNEILAELAKSIAEFSRSTSDPE